MMGKAILWGILAFVVGGYVTAAVAGAVSVFIPIPKSDIWFWGGALFFGIAAFVSSKNNQGKPPRWLWRSKDAGEK